MKLLYQFGIILGVTFAGEVCRAVIPLPVPAGIYGLVIMLICLGTNIIKPEQVKAAADFLLDIMPPMFIPAAVGFITVWKDLQEVLVPVLVITCLTTVLVMAVTGKTAQYLIQRKNRDRKG